MGFAGIGGGTAALGTVASFFTSKLLQEDAQQFQTAFYKQRYQRQMEDMRKAGLNPILSYKTGVPGTASASISSAGGIAGAGSAGLAAGAALSQAESAKTQATSAKGLREQQNILIGQQIDTEETQQALNRDKGLAERANANLRDAQTALEQSQLPQAALRGQFYSGKYGRPAVTTQETGSTAKSLLPWIQQIQRSR